MSSIKQRAQEIIEEVARHPRWKPTNSKEGMVFVEKCGYEYATEMEKAGIKPRTHNWAYLNWRLFFFLKEYGMPIDIYGSLWSELRSLLKRKLKLPALKHEDSFWSAKEKENLDKRITFRGAVDNFMIVLQLTFKKKLTGKY